MVDKKIPVSPRALLQRINRALKSKGRVMHKLKPSSRNYAEFGPYWILESNTVVDGKINADRMERMAKRLNVMAEWEVLAEDES